MSDSALAAATAAFEAADRRDWQALFNVLDPSAIERFKVQQRHMLSLSERGAFFARRSKSVGLLKHVFAVESLEAYDALPAALVLRRWLVVSHGRSRKAEKPERRRTVVGEVSEGSDVAHVVFRESFNEEDRVRVISARRTTYGWREPSQAQDRVRLSGVVPSGMRSTLRMATASCWTQVASVTRGVHSYR